MWRVGILQRPYLRSRTREEVAAVCPCTPAFSILRQTARLPRQMPVFDPVRLVGRCAEAFSAVSLVFRIVSVEPHHRAVSLKGQNMGGDAVQEPPVMADHHGAAREVLEQIGRAS